MKHLFKTLSVAALLLAANPAAAAPAEPGLAPVSSELSFVYQDQSFAVPGEELSSWRGQSKIQKTPQLVYRAPSLFALARNPLSPQTEQKPAISHYRFQPQKVFSYIKRLAQKINSGVVEPELIIAGGRAEKFTPPKIGKITDAYQSTIKALEALENGRTEAELAVKEIQPQQSLSQLNGLGIAELLAEGKSNFAGSTKNRRHNITIGAEKMKGVIILPGEEFSFNKYLGPVEKSEGFVPELVIKRTGTVPELGGGLCQVSSTVFRTAMTAGVPITQRRNHAYAVQYYAPQGTDATIYPGVVDLKFVNDTPGAILVWPDFPDKDNLVFQFYGTKDSRQITLEKPYQYDRKPDGSMKAVWTRIVTKDGETATSTFKSTYLSPALFHKEETFVTPTATTPLAPTAPAAGG